MHLPYFYSELRTSNLQTCFINIHGISIQLSPCDISVSHTDELEYELKEQLKIPSQDLVIWFLCCHSAKLHFLTGHNIQKTVANYYKIKVSEMYSKKRSRNIARPRQIAMALAKELTHLSLPDIGEAFGGRDHTTVLHACRKVAALKTTNLDITKDFDSLLKVLRS